MGKKVKDPGFGGDSNVNARRLINKDGSFNIKRLNSSSQFLETYHYLISISWPKFFGLSVASFFTLNTLFACVYLLIGIDEITPTTASFYHDFLNAFFFSSQTLTTLGYGTMSPNGVLSGLVSSCEAFVGLSMFAFLTGLIYGRFSKPKASIRFSENIILRDFNHTKAIMFRLVNNRASVMIQPKITVTLSLTKLNNVGNHTRSFYNLELERDTITYLPTTWTVVHEITDESPLFDFKNEELINKNGEFLILITYFDESFNQEVHQMHSYTLNELKMDYKFVSANYYDTDGKMVLDYKLFDKIEALKR